MPWFDNHCHLRAGDHGVNAIAQAHAAGVTRLLTVGTDVEQSRLAISIAKANDGVWATAGVHPHDASGGVDGLAELLAHPKVVAVGEAGFDFYYDHSPRTAQYDVFAAQIALAHELDLPLVIHTRDAWAETFELLDREGVPRRSVFHCFTGGPREASAALERGCYLSISGIVTFPSAPELRAAVAAAPLERLFVETDSPYLAPVPYRGKPNQPAHVVVIGAAIAALKSLPAAQIEAATWSNASRFYALPDSELSHS